MPINELVRHYLRFLKQMSASFHDLAADQLSIPIWMIWVRQGSDLSSSPLLLEYIKQYPTAEELLGKFSMITEDGDDRNKRLEFEKTVRYVIQMLLMEEALFCPIGLEKDGKPSYDRETVKWRCHVAARLISIQTLLQHIHPGAFFQQPRDSYVTVPGDAADHLSVGAHSFQMALKSIRGTELLNLLEANYSRELGFLLASTATRVSLNADFDGDRR